MSSSRFRLPGWLLCLLLLPLALQARDLTVIRPDNSGLEFVLRPLWDRAFPDSLGALRLSTLDSMDPDDPVEQVRIALPPGARGSAHILESRSRALPGRPSASLGAAVARPPLEAREQAWRDLSTLVLEFGLFPQPGRMLEEVRVRVDFIGGNGTGGPSACSALELGQCLLNPHQASRWAPPRGAARITQPAAWEGGTWVRIPVSEEGLYRITPQDLGALGLNPANFDPATVQLYGHDGQMIPDDPSSPRNGRSRMLELPMIREHDGDGAFAGSDRLLFYGRGLSGLARNDEGRIRHTQHYYDTRNEVWLLLDGLSPGRSMAPIGGATAGTVVDRVIWRTFIDENINNARNSARDWYGAEFVNSNSRSWSWAAPLGSGSRPVRADYKFSYSTNPSNVRDSLRFEVNGIPLGGRGVRPSSTGAVEEQLTLSGTALTFSITQLQSTGIPVLLDYIGLSVEALPAFADGVCRFESPELPGPWSTTVAGFPGDGYLLDVTWPDSVRVTRDSAFRDRVPEDPAQPGNGLQRVYFGVAGNRLRPITGAVLEDQPDLLAQSNTCALVVIAPESLADAVQPLVDHRNASGSIRARLVTLEDVYRQFNAGVADPGAVRNFLKAEYESGLPAPELAYALLVGNGHYDPIGRITGAWPDLFPAWYKGASMVDEYYGRLLGPATMDIAVGRLAAWSASEVTNYVDKVLRLENGQDDGAWRNRLLFVGDDEHGENDVVRSWESDHTQHTEFLIRTMVPESFDVERIYTVEFPTVYNPEIRVNEKPLAEKRLLDGIREGAALINYIGHGNNTTWSHEYVFNTSKHLSLLPANNRPSTFLAATCSWAEIDLPIGLALPQQLLTLPRGGAIGVMAATRNTTSGGNDRFARNLFPALFAAWSDSLAPWIPVAEAMRIAKNSSASSNDELYLYLGDPSMLPGFPEQGGRIASVRRPDGAETDTLLTLELATVEAETGPFNALGGAAIEQGNALVVVREAAVPRRYYYDLPTTGNVTVPDSLDYENPGALLFAGRVAFEGGRPLTRFIVPADFSGRTAPGDIRLYYMGDGPDGRPADGLIHGTGIHFALNANPPTDDQAPALRLSFNGPQWREGDLLAPNSSTWIVLQDSSGINLTGEIGHRIELVIDGGTPVDLTPHFVYDSGSYTQGTVKRELPWLEAGVHEARVRAFDNFNNPGYAEARFELVETGALRLQDLVNHPNPVSGSTRFTFRLEGLALEPPPEVEVRVFTTRGRRVFGDHLALEGNESLYFTEAWRPRDDRGDPLARGVYLYQLRLRVPATSFSRVDELGNLVSGRVGGGLITANGSLIVD